MHPSIVPRKEHGCFAHARYRAKSPARSPHRGDRFSPPLRERQRRNARRRGAERSSRRRRGVLGVLGFGDRGWYGHLAAGLIRGRWGGHVRTGTKNVCFSLCRVVTRCIGHTDLPAIHTVSSSARIPDRSASTARQVARTSVPRAGIGCLHEHGARAKGMWKRRVGIVLYTPWAGVISRSPSCHHVVSSLDAKLPATTGAPHLPEGFVAHGNHRSLSSRCIPSA